MLLTDEEIRTKWLGGWEEQNLESVDIEDLKNNLYFEDMYALKAVAKAQLKKVVGYLLDNELIPSYKGDFIISFECWQALLDEVK